MTNNSSLRAKIFIILLVMSEVLAIVLTVAMVFNYQQAIKGYYGHIGDNISSQIVDYLDIDKLREDYNKKQVTADLKYVKEMLQYTMKHYSLHEISIFSLYDNYVEYFVNTSNDNYYEMNFDRLNTEKEKLQYVDKNIISFTDVIESTTLKSRDGEPEQKRYSERTIASYIIALGDRSINPPIYLNIDFDADVINNQIRDFALSIITFCTFALILEGLILFVYLRYLVINPLNEFSDRLNQVKTDKDLKKIDLSHIDTNTIELSTFKKEVINVINKYSQYSDLLNESILENKRSQYAIKTLSTFAEERGLPKSFYDDKNESYTICGMLDTVNNKTIKNYYDYFMIDEYRLCILVFENNQASMASVLFMDMLKDKIKQDTLKGYSISDIFTKISKFMLNIDWVGIAINAYEAIINLRTGEVEYVVAGDIYTSILVDKGIYKEYIDIPLDKKPKFSIKENAVFNSNKFTLLPNEKMFIYTNDILNLLSLESGRFGKEVLLHYLNNYANEKTDKFYNILTDKIMQIRYSKNDMEDESAFLLFDMKKYIGDKGADLS